MKHPLRSIQLLLLHTVAAVLQMDASVSQVLKGEIFLSISRQRLEGILITPTYFGHPCSVCQNNRAHRFSQDSVGCCRRLNKTLAPPLKTFGGPPWQERLQRSENERTPDRQTHSCGMRQIKDAGASSPHGHLLRSRPNLRCMGRAWWILAALRGLFKGQTYF
jgi:hypothetical protein